MNIIKVSSLCSLDLDGKFCQRKHPRAGPSISLLDIPISIICTWSSSSATTPSSTGFRAKSERKRKISSFVSPVSPFQTTSEINLLHLKKRAEWCWTTLMDDTAALSISSSPTPPFSVWDCLTSWVATLDAPYLAYIKIINRFKLFTWRISIPSIQQFARENHSVRFFFFFLIALISISNFFPNKASTEKSALI